MDELEEQGLQGDNLEEEELDESKILGLIDDLENEIEKLKSAKQVKTQELFEAIRPRVEEYLAQITEVVDKELEEINQELDEKFGEEGEKREEDIAEINKRIDGILKNLAIVEKLQNSIKEVSKLSTTNKLEAMTYAEATAKTSSEIAYRALNLINDLSSKLPDIKEGLDSVHTRIDNLPDEYDDKDVWEELKELRKLILSRPVGGGNMNRNVAVGGNSSVLSRYTDINWKAGSNVTLTYVNNDNTKAVDITIASSGGGGSVLGTTRSINNISTSQTAGAVTNTDYVYIASVGVALTLPTAVSNTNLYTVKNTSTSSVLVATTSAQTIDAASNLILATQYTAVDLISDGSNWDIT